MYLPTIIKDIGFTDENTCLITAAVYAFTCLTTLIVGYVAAHRNEHSYPLVVVFSIGILGFLSMIFLTSLGKIAACISLCIAFSGTHPALPIIISWATNNVGGQVKRAVAFSFLSAIAQIGAIIPFQVSNI